MEIDADREPARASAVFQMRGRTRVPRLISEFESDIRQLYLGMLDEPVPPRLIGILRAGMAPSKS